MRQIHPPCSGGQHPDLAALYAYPAAAATRPWVRANMIESVDGAAQVDGLSGGLSGAADREVFGLLRALAEVILVGAGTARAEQYKPARVRPQWAALRTGRPAVPPIALLTGRLDLDLASPLFTGAAADARTLVITTAAAPAGRRAEATKHAEVIIAGDRQIDPAAAIGALAERGYRRILTEGGPHLLSQIASAGLLDELCVTVSPVLAGGTAGRILSGGVTGHPAATAAGSAAGAASATGAPDRLDLAHVLEADGYLLCRYLRHPS